MTYKKSLKYVHSLNRFGIKPGLERITALLNRLGDPHLGLSCIHIAGTNGKGSTSTALSNVMQAAGKKTGLFISPYVVDFRERIQINGEYISKKVFSRLTKRLAGLVPDVEAEVGDSVTEFEFITALMFTYFAEQKCDLVVLEVGLGGRLDSTNVIQRPLASVITKIALDHLAVLGDTIQKIAAEKSGIIKSGCPVITAATQPQSALEVIKDTAARLRAELLLAEPEAAKGIACSPRGSAFTYRDVNLTLNMPGRHQIENMSLVVDTALALSLPKKAIVEGIAATRFPARLEIIGNTPFTILDGAHNENGALVLAEFLAENNLRPVTLMGMMADKDCASVARSVAAASRAVYTVAVRGNPRTISADQLATLAKQHCNTVCAKGSYRAALRAAKKTAEKLNAPVLICGSLYLASDIRNMAIKSFKK